MRRRALARRHRRARCRRATRAPTSATTWWSCSTRWRRRGSSSMAPRPSTLIAELSYQCPLHCPYCSNPLDIGHERYRDELETEHWIRAFGEARRLGVLQLALTGGEPMLRRDLVELCAGARDAGLYSSLITAGTLFTRERAEALKAAGLDHVQISIQSPDPEDNDRIAGNRSFEKKIAAARHARELGFPLTINCVLHRQNLDRIEELLDLTLELGAQRLELANTQYYGWAVPNQQALMPSRDQLERGGGGGPAVPRAGRSQGPGPLGAPRLLRGAAEAVHGRLGHGQRWWWRRTATSCRARRRRRSPGSSSPTSATTRSSGSGTSPARSRASAARTGCRSRAGRARSGARRRTSAAAAARRCGSRATRRPPIPCAGTRPTTTASSRRGSSWRPDEFVYRAVKRPVRSEA